MICVIRQHKLGVWYYLLPCSKWNRAFEEKDIGSVFNEAWQERPTSFSFELCK